MTSIDDVFREHRPRVLAGLIGFLGDFDLAEEAVQDAFAVAVARWGTTGVPDNPAGWLITTARNSAIDRLRREQTLRRKLPLLLAEPSTPEEAPVDPDHIPDERLELIFTCCHPALSTEAQVALTLRTLGGLETPALARAFLVTPETMKRRLTRAKARIRGCGIPFRVPPVELLPARLDAVQAVIYLIFNHGYGATDALGAEAIRLGALLCELMPSEVEPLGLLALMELVHARRAARRDSAGDLVRLAEQDRAQWDATAIARGRELLVRAAELGEPGSYTLQALIAAEHCAPVVDWARIAALYGRLAARSGSPVVELSRAVAIAQTGAPGAALALIETPAIMALDDYQYLHSTRGELLARLGRPAEARTAFTRALALACDPAERRFLERRCDELAAARTS